MVGVLSSQDVATLNKFSIPCLYYLCPLANIESMIRNGVLSFNAASRQVKTFNSIANENVRRRRKTKWVGGRWLTDYANFYLRPWTPMQYNLQAKQDSFAVVKLSRELFGINGMHFSDGNAASNPTKFYTALADLNNLDWQIINTQYGFDRESIRKRAAEVLIPDKAEPEFIEEICVMSTCAETNSNYTTDDTLFV